MTLSEYLHPEQQEVNRTNVLSFLADFHLLGQYIIYKKTILFVCFEINHYLCRD